MRLRQLSLCRVVGWLVLLFVFPTHAIPSDNVTLETPGPSNASQVDLHNSSRGHAWEDAAYSFWNYFPDDTNQMQDLAKPSDVSGTYRGNWQQLTLGSDLKKFQLPQKTSGIIIFQLEQLAASTNGTVHSVEGELVLRDGISVTDNDVRMHLDGVFVPASGRLHAVLKPRIAVRQRASDPQYQAMRESNSQDYRTSLRAMVRAWQMHHGLVAMALPDVTRDSALPLMRECSFRLEAQATVRTLREAVAGTGGPADVAAAEKEAEELAVMGSARRLLLHGGPGSSSPLLAGAPAEAGRALARAPEELMMGGGGGGGGAAPGAPAPGPLAQGTAGQADTGPTVLEVSALGVVFSDNCNLALSFNASSFHLDGHYAKAVRYSLMATAATMAQILLVMRQMEHCATQSGAAKVALWTMSHQALMDAYLCLLHLTAALVVDALFNAFATTSFFQFMLFAVFEMRFILLIWRAQRSNSTNDLWSGRRELGMLYTRFYAILLGGIFMAYQLQNYLHVVMFLLYSFWWPQIIHSAQTEARQPLLLSYILGTTATRLLLPLYLYGCPHNILHPNKVQPLLLGALLIWVGIQVALLLAQHHFGPRCFIPRMFLPQRYDYFRVATTRELGLVAGEPAAAAADVETGHGSVECVICMSPVEHLRPAARCITPCGHFFHSACLQRWMDVKMECPTCRRVLPPL